jgi:hypothetical protein
VRRSAALLAAPLMVAAWVGLNPIHAAADTQTTCSDPTACKTVTVDGNGALTSGSTSGTITIGSLQPSTTYSLVDVIEGLGTNHVFIGGSYTISFSPTCTAGSATGSTYTVQGGASTYPSAPPATSGTLPTITTDGSGTFSCAYTLTYPTIDGTNDSTCDGHLCSVRNDIFVMSGSTTVTQLASQSVPPGGSPPTSVPEAPWAILIPAVIVLTGGVGMVLWRRKLAPAS